MNYSRLPAWTAFGVITHFFNKHLQPSHKDISLVPTTSTASYVSNFVILSLAQYSFTVSVRSLWCALHSRAFRFLLRRLPFSPDGEEPPSWELREKLHATHRRSLVLFGWSSGDDFVSETLTCQKTLPFCSTSCIVEATEGFLCLFSSVTLKAVTRNALGFGYRLKWRGICWQVLMICTW